MQSYKENNTYSTNLFNSNILIVYLNLLRRKYCTESKEEVKIIPELWFNLDPERILNGTIIPSDVNNY